MALEIAPQPAPAELQRCHWYSYLVGFSLHVPVLALSVCPTTALPEIVGGALLAGLEGTSAVCPDLAGMEGPTELDAVTDTRSVLPSSAEPTA